MTSKKYGYFDFKTKTLRGKDDRIIYKMPKKYDRCISDVKKKIRSGKIPKTYKKGRKRLKSSPYKICARLR